MVKLNFEIPKNESADIKVLGVGGGGNNAVNFMLREGISGVEFIICNTDNQALSKSPVEKKVQIGNNITGGRGVGGDPEVGEQSAKDDIEKIKAAIGAETKMLFITAGMGGGTGTGATPVIAKLSKDMDILTVAIVTYPFEFEGEKRKKVAEAGIEELRKHVDALIIIRNERLLEMYNELGITKAFSHADNVLATAAKGIAEIITVPGEMNVDFEDVKAIMKNSGTAIMGNGVAEGEDRAFNAVKLALNSPLLKEKDIKGAKHILLNISYGDEEVQIDEITKITNYVRKEVGSEVDMKLGHCCSENLGKSLSITIIATCLEGSAKDLPKVRLSYIEEIDDEENTQLPINFNTREPYLKHSSDNKKRPALDLKSPKSLETIENVPAYIRKNVQLSDIPHSSEQQISRLTLDDDTKEKPGVREDNSYLSDNPD